MFCDPRRVNPPTPTTNNRKLTILQINDTHGYLEPHRELFWQGDKAEYRPSGGYVRVGVIGSPPNSVGGAD